METQTVKRQKRSPVTDFDRPKEVRIIHYISGVHMGLSHRGLGKLSAKYLKNAELGDFIVFMNNARTAFKMLAPNNVLVYYRHPKDHPIDPRVIPLLPKVFNGRELDVDSAVKSVILKDFKKMGKYAQIQ